MHRNVTHNRCYASFTDFSTAILTFLRDEVPRNWRRYCDQVSDNFRVIDPTNFRGKWGKWGQHAFDRELHADPIFCAPAVTDPWLQ